MLWSVISIGEEMMVAEGGGLTCRELVELVTDYLAGSLSPAQRVMFEEHLATCEGCSNYMDQFKTTIEILGNLPEESIPPDARKRLLRAFETWKLET
jgi:anti-sigma factor RsiW